MTALSMKKVNKQNRIQQITSKMQQLSYNNYVLIHFLKMKDFYADFLDWVADPKAYELKNKKELTVDGNPLQVEVTAEPVEEKKKTVAKTVRYFKEKLLGQQADHSSDD